MKNEQPIKTGEKIGKTYCLVSKYYIDNFKPQVIKMTNKVLREKSNCVVWRSKKSRFLKHKQSKTKISNPVKIKKQVLQVMKTCIRIVLTVKNIQVTRFQKKQFSFQRIKPKEYHNVCLTERAFIYEIDGKYELEGELEIYLQFFTD